MIDPWNDYCTGSSYSLQYVSGPKLPAGGDPLTVNIGAFYTDVTKYNTPGLAVDPYLAGTIPDLTWEGTHNVQLVAQQGTTKQYRRILGPIFQITYLSPCKATTITPQIIPMMTFTVGNSVPQFTVY